MKYEIKLRRSFSQWGRTTIEAVNDGQAHALACGLTASDIAVWKTPDEFLEVVSVRLGEQPKPGGGGASAGITSDDLPTEIREGLHVVLDYFYDDYAEDYETLTKAEREGHIFEFILRLSRWLHEPARQR